MSKDKYLYIFLKLNGGCCVCYCSNSFTQCRILGDPFLNFKAENTIHCNNLLWIKSERVNVNLKFRLMGNILSASHVVFRPIACTKNI